jgi:hypothetical protein
MDRISALRNIEDALAAFEAGESTLADLEGQVRGILRTYAADLDGELGAYRATGEGFEERVVVAGSLENTHRMASGRADPARWSVPYCVITHRNAWSVNLGA